MPRCCSSTQSVASWCALAVTAAGRSSVCGLVMEQRISSASATERWLRTLQSGWICRPRRITAGMSTAHTEQRSASLRWPDDSRRALSCWQSATSCSSLAYVSTMASVSRHVAGVVAATVSSRSPTTMRASARMSGEALCVM